MLASMLLFTGIASAKSDAFLTVQACEIIAKIEKGEPVNYSHITVQGDLNISKIGIPGTGSIASPIKISDSVISGFVIFDGLTLQKETNFKRTEFEEPVSLEPDSGEMLFLRILNLMGNLLLQKQSSIN